MDGSGRILAIIMAPEPMASNWNENQYDLLLKPGAIEGDTVKLKVLNRLSSFFTDVMN